MWDLVKLSLQDEDGDVSSPRLNTFLLTLVGVFVILAGLVMVGFGVAGVTSYVGLVVGGIFGKNASDTWASQLKSAKVKVAKEQAKTPSPAAPASTPAPAPATPATPATGGAK